MSLFFSSAVACFVSIPRARSFNDAAMRRGLVGLLATTGLWAFLKTVFFIIPDPFREATYVLGLIFGFATVWAWLYFASAYTERSLHMNQTLRRLSAAVFLTVVSIKVTNPLHGLYFTTTQVTVPFDYLAINHGIVHWVSTSLSYVLAAVGLFMIFELYVESGYDTRPLGFLTGLLALPVTLDIVAIATPDLINFIYAPIGVAAFAIGTLFIFGDQFLTVRTTAQGDDLAIILDDNDRIQDYSPAAADVFPELADATGDQLGEVLPTVAATRNDDGQIVERGGDDERIGERNDNGRIVERDGDDRRIVERDDDDGMAYYLVSPRSMTLGDSALEVLALTDVTGLERQRRRLIERERELNERSELYRAVIAASFAFVFRIDVEGRFQFVSPSVEEFLGYTPTELTGEPMSVLGANDESVELAMGYFAEVKEGESIQVQDLPITTRSDRTVYVDVRTVPIYDADIEPASRTADDIVGAQVMVQDASDRRQREGLISVINRVLRHNVRNKLTVISGYAEILAGDSDDNVASKAEQITQATDRLLDLTESARQIEQNRELSPELEQVDLAPLLDESIDELETRYPEAAITAEIPETAVATTLPRIETALWELLENAAVHGGEEPTVSLGVTAADDQLRITISDEGPGLPEDERQVLTTGDEDPLVHGQGLGLWLTYWIITSLDGEISVPKKSGGTTIEIRLPTPSSAD
jgi:PAS domain S-box